MNKVYYHTYAPSQESLDVIDDLLKRSIKLINSVDKFNIIVTGDFAHESMKRMKVLTGVDNRFNFILQNKIKSNERSTLHLLHEASNKNDKIFYFHSKGATKAGTGWMDIINGWSYKLLYFLVDQHEKCIEFLNDYDVVGANYWGEFTPDSCRESCNQDKNPPPHFSGNFWWARGDHIKRLKIPIGFGYNDPEFWATSVRPIKIAAMSNISINPYMDNCEFESYKDEKPKFSFLEN